MPDRQLMLTLDYLVSLMLTVRTTGIENELSSDFEQDGRLVGNSVPKGRIA
jgi:hypothetical protein